MGKRGVEEQLVVDWQALVGALDDRPQDSPLARPPQQRMPIRPTALFAELEDVRQDWGELGNAARAHADRYVNAGWTLQELLAHLASWAREFRHQVETVLQGRALDYAIPFAMSVLGPNQWNEEQVEARRERSLDEILAEFDTQTDRLQQLVLEAPAERLYQSATFPEAPSGDPQARWSGSCALLVLAKCRHDRYHIAQIRERMGSWS